MFGEEELIHYENLEKVFPFFLQECGLDHVNPLFNTFFSNGYVCEDTEAEFVISWLVWQADYRIDRSILWLTQDHRRAQCRYSQACDHPIPRGYIDLGRAQYHPSDLRIHYTTNSTVRFISDPKHLLGRREIDVLVVEGDEAAQIEAIDYLNYLKPSATLVTVICGGA